MRVPRPRWVPQTAEQRRAIAAVVRAAKTADEAEGKLRDLVAAAHRLKVPVAHLAEAANRTRATIYRHLPSAEEPRGPESGANADDGQG
jgi:AcrR family transcriptional regulator